MKSALLLILGVSLAESGGFVGGGGDYLSKNWFWVVQEMVFNLRERTELQDLLPQLEDNLKNPQRIVIQKQLLDCQGKPAGPAHFAMTCPGETRLPETWIPLLSSPTIARAYAEEILHETFRASALSFQGPSPVNDEAFAQSRRVFYTGHPLRKVGCTEQITLNYRRWMYRKRDPSGDRFVFGTPGAWETIDAARQGFKSSEQIHDGCIKDYIRTRAVNSVEVVNEVRLRCRALADLYLFYFDVPREFSIPAKDLPDGRAYLGTASRICIAN